MRHFREFNTEVIGISFDEVEANLRFSQTNEFPYPILSDGTREIGLKYGACSNRAAPVPKRISYLIDERQRIVYSWTRIDPALHAGQVINTLYANYYKTFEEWASRRSQIANSEREL